MLTEPMKELLTAFVDGELSQRQRKAVMRLLQKSAEARELVRQLQENAHKIKQLPRRKCEPSLVDEVLAAIAEQRVQPKPASPRKSRRRRWLPYVAAGLAASIMVGSAALLYWKSVQEQRAGQNNAIVEHKQPEIPAPKEDVQLLPKIDKKPEPTPPRKTNPLLANMIDETFRAAAMPIAEPKMFTASFNDLKSGDRGTANLLARELDREKVAQLDITVKDNALALGQLKTVLQSRGIRLVADPSANKAIASKAKVEYLVYADNFTSDELSKLMTELAQQMVVSGPKGNNQKTVESPYKQVAVAPIAEDSKIKLAKWLGIPESAIEPKSGGNVKPAPKRDRAVVLLPTNAKSPSPEVRQFLNQRRPQAGTIPVLIKIRQE